MTRFVICTLCDGCKTCVNVDQISNIVEAHETTESAIDYEGRHVSYPVERPTRIYFEGNTFIEVLESMQYFIDIVNAED